MENKGKIGIGIAVVAVIAVLGGFWFYTQTNTDYMKESLETDRIYEGVSIEGIHVGGLTKEEAYELVGEKFNEESNSKVIIFKMPEAVGGEEVASLEYSDIDARKDVQSAVDEAYNVARTEGDIKANYKIYTDVKQNGYNIFAKMSYDTEKLDNFLSALEERTTSEAKDSTIELVNGQFVVEEDIYGFQMDKASMAVQVAAMLDTYADGEVIIDGTDTQPKIKKEDNEKVTSLLGTFSTKYTGGDSLGRNINLKVGCDNITGTVLAPGEVFSMNEGLGDQTYANGYRNASVIVNGKLEDGIAGGVCQITTTLYNAVVQAELGIVERKNHSLAVAYVPMGQDAAVAGTYKDFKFENTTDYPIYIEAYAQNGVLVTNIYGFETRSANRKIVLEHVYIGSYPKPAEKVTLDPELPEGERIVTYEGKLGHKVSTYKVVYENGELISREWFNDSVYSPVADEVTVGTGEPAEAVEDGGTTDGGESGTVDEQASLNGAAEVPEGLPGIDESQEAEAFDDGIFTEDSGNTGVLEEE